MKSLLALLLSIIILLSAMAFLPSCNVADPASGGESSSSEAASNSDNIADQMPVRQYGKYSVITDLDEATEALVENMFSHKSWFYVNAQSSLQTMQSAFESYVMNDNTYLGEILEREDGIDLLLWQYDKIAQDPISYQTGINNAGVNFSFCIFHETVQARMTEEQKTAAEAMSIHVRSGKTIPAGTPISLWECTSCDDENIYFAFADEKPSYCLICERDGNYELIRWLYGDN